MQCNKMESTADTSDIPKLQMVKNMSICVEKIYR